MTCNNCGASLVMRVIGNAHTSLTVPACPNGCITEHRLAPPAADEVTQLHARLTLVEQENVHLRIREAAVNEALRRQAELLPEEVRADLPAAWIRGLGFLVRRYRDDAVGLKKMFEDAVRELPQVPALLARIEQLLHALQAATARAEKADSRLVRERDAALADVSQARAELEGEKRDSDRLHDELKAERAAHSATRAELTGMTHDRDLWQELASEVTTGHVQEMLRACLVALGADPTKHEITASVSAHGIDRAVTFIDPKLAGEHIAAAIGVSRAKLGQAVVALRTLKEQHLLVCTTDCLAQHENGCGIRIALAILADAESTATAEAPKCSLLDVPYVDSFALERHVHCGSGCVLGARRGGGR